MKKDIIVDAGLLQTRSALIENGEPVEIFIEGNHPQRLAGNIYRGIVKKVLPGIQAAFVDIGAEKNAFLYASEAVPGKKIFGNLSCDKLSNINKKEFNFRIEDLVKPGQEITVQVIKEPIEAKGARITMDITIPGRYSVLLPKNNIAAVSGKIINKQERDRLKSIAVRFLTEGIGIIIRTVSEGIDEVEIEKDILMLLQIWQSIIKKEREGKVPRILHKEPGLPCRLARDYLNSDINRFVINDREGYNELLKYLNSVSPDLKKKVEYYCKDYDLFEYYHVESAINEALSRKIWLKCGGYIVFDKTEALTVIDVNTGKFVGKDDHEDTILRTNLEAAKAIGRQIRLRNIGGIILVDFIDMKENSHKQRLLSFLKETVSRDRSKVFIEGMTNLGLVEMTRKKVCSSLQQSLTKPCHLCRGTGNVPSPDYYACSVINSISDAASGSISDIIEVEVHPEIYKNLNDDNKGVIKKIEQIYQKKIELIPVLSIEYGKMKVKHKYKPEDDD